MGSVEGSRTQESQGKGALLARSCVSLYLQVLIVVLVVSTSTATAASSEELLGS